MHTSEQVNELMTALADAQGEIGGAVKDSTNPHFRSSYSDLASVISAIRAPFAKHGLCYIQGPGQLVDGVVLVTTRIGHKSGQWIETTAHIPIGQKVNAQTYGSCATYGRRYSLQSLAGVPSIDDDGNATALEAPQAPPKLTEMQVASLKGLLGKLPLETTAAFLRAYQAPSVEELDSRRYDAAMKALREKVAAA